jgi:F-box-like
MSASLNSIGKLPKELTINSFSYLEPSDVTSCCHVSKDWQTAANENRLWTTMAKRMGNGNVPNVPNIKAYVQEQDSRSPKNEKIIHRLQAFLDRISLGQNANFKCHIVGSNNQTISVEFMAFRNNGRFDLAFEDNYDTARGIGDGSLSTPQPPYQINTNRLENHTHNNERRIVYKQGPLQVTVKFPELSHIDVNSQTDLQKRITNMVAIKLDSLVDELGQIHDSHRFSIVTRHLLSAGILFYFEVPYALPIWMIGACVDMLWPRKNDSILNELDNPTEGKPRL